MLRRIIFGAVDHDGKLLKSLRKILGSQGAAFGFMERYGQPKVIVTDLLRSYRAAMSVFGNAVNQECG